METEEGLECLDWGLSDPNLDVGTAETEDFAALYAQTLEEEGDPVIWGNPQFATEDLFWKLLNASDEEIDRWINNVFADPRTPDQFTPPNNALDPGEKIWTGAGMLIGALSVIAALIVVFAIIVAI